MFRRKKKKKNMIKIVDTSGMSVPQKQSYLKIMKKEYPTADIVTKKEAKKMAANYKKTKSSRKGKMCKR